MASYFMWFETINESHCVHEETPSAFAVFGVIKSLCGFDLKEEYISVTTRVCGFFPLLYHQSF